MELPRGDSVRREGEVERHLEPSLGHVLQVEPLIVSVELLEAGARVRQPDPGPARAWRFQEPRPVVAHAQYEHSLLSPSGDLDLPAAGLRRDAVLDRVLHERLQDQVGYARRKDLGRNVEGDLQPILEPRRLDLHVHLEELELAGERDELRGDRKSTRLNSSHVEISYAVFCLKKK